MNHSCTPAPPHGNIRRAATYARNQWTKHARQFPPSHAATYARLQSPRAANTPEPIMNQSWTAHQNPGAITELKSTYTSYTAETQKVSNNSNLVDFNHIKTI